MEANAEVPQPNIRLRSGSPKEEGEEASKEPEETKTPEEHGTQNQLTGMHGGLQGSGRLYRDLI